MFIIKTRGEGMELFFQTLINGLQTGSIFALIAIGYTMVYGIAKMINFAHGDIIMVGAYSICILTTQSNVPAIPAVILTILICTLVGITVERWAYKPLRSAPSLAVLITAIGVSLLLQSLALIIFGEKQRPFVSIIKVPSINIGGVVIQGIALVTFIVTIICMVVLNLFIRKTKLGRAMRAVSEDKQAAQLMGINVNRTISMTFAIGSALAGVAGILYICQYLAVKPTLGALPGIKAFVAAVLGGIGSIPGAMVGGILLGVIESIFKCYLPSELTDAIVFGVLVLVLLVKPSGILGSKRIEKV